MNLVKIYKRNMRICFDTIDVTKDNDDVDVYTTVSNWSVIPRNLTYNTDATKGIVNIRNKGIVMLSLNIEFLLKSDNTKFDTIENFNDYMELIDG